MKKLLVIFCALLSGCATNISRESRGEELRDGSSILVLSITNQQAAIFNGANSLAPTLRFRNEATGNILIIQGHVGTLWEKHLLNENGYSIGRVVAIQVAAGIYKFEGLTAHGVQSVNFPNLSFIVDSGEIVYVGNMEVQMHHDGAT